MRKHGMTGTKTWSTWRDMVWRCTGKTCTAYKNYGGRGISVCDEWLHSFKTFYDDMGERPEGCEIDRIDNNGNYCKENCRWVTTLQNARNKRNNRIVVVDGRRFTLSECAEYYNMRTGLILKRLNLGWTPERAVATPVLLRSEWGNRTHLEHIKEAK